MEQVPTRGFDDMDEWGMGLFSGAYRGWLPAFISTLTSLGLPAMERLIAGNDEYRRVTLHRAFRATGGRDLVENLFAGAHAHATGLEPHMPPQGYEDDPRFAPPAYLYYQGSELCVVDAEVYTFFFDLQYNPLRERAYVFWDEWRVEILGVEWDIDNFGEMEEEWTEGAGRFYVTGLQERLRGVRSRGLWRLPSSRRLVMRRELGTRG